MTDPTRVSCPQCAAVNRVPSARLADAPICGRCKVPLFGAAPIELDQAAFGRFLADNDLPVLVDFWAPWCGPCMQMAPTFHAAAGKLEPNMRLVKLNTEANPQLAAQLNIRSIPTLAVFANGREVSRQSGALPGAQLLQFAAQSVAKANTGYA
ncbi:thioredoxin [Panacagrimonas perspica]|uniref:Thioredoxin n=1 Tax=Panacagrimonas perspica TaxID=381431 RepID=A0A4R7PEK7_9GAMM|nr:thioredoxin TrxC [Panacagrimonas perspica]TDU32547.1 thioredoxin [Panacagrimonas perspica]THD05449.1 thiol reductase thioredoxin [Panacagrimonas perspica]